MKRALFALLACSAAVGVFARAPEAPPAKEAAALRQKLVQITAEKDDNEFLFQLGSLLREQHIDMLLKKGDRVAIGKSQLILQTGEKLRVQTPRGASPVTEPLAHYVLDDGSWLAQVSRPERATHFVMSTQDVVFVINLVDQRMSVLKR